MIAEIVSVGTELLMGQIADTNAQILGQLLPEYGIDHHFRQTVGDNLGRLLECLRLALSRSDIVFTIGGLGPTEDDLTRDGIAAALGETLVHDPKIEQNLRNLLAMRKLPWQDSQLRQAQRPASAKIISNATGTAPGLLCQKKGKTIIALPGPRGEFSPMAKGFVAEYLGSLNTDRVIHSRILKVVGIGESVVESKLGELIHSSNPSIAPYAKLGEVHLRVSSTAKSLQDAQALAEPVIAKIKTILGNAIFGEDDTLLEDSIIALLSKLGQKVATAESVTGGGLARRLTNVAGASAFFEGGVVTYNADQKKRLLGVESQILDKFGPVSSECAARMAEKAKSKFNTDWAIATTGNAGPTADIDGKPVGLVYVAVAGPGKTLVQEHQYRAQRNDVRVRTEQAALTLFRSELLYSAS